MNSRMWGIIGGLAVVLALLSPYVLGSTKKVKQLFEDAETLYESTDYEAAIAKYEDALEGSKKLLAKTETIDEDFTTFVNFKIAMSYVRLAEHESNPSHYAKALEYVEKASHTVKRAKYEEHLTYLWGYILYKTGQLEQAAEKLAQLIANFPDSRFEEKAEEIIAQINEQSRVPEDGGAENITQQPNLVPPIWTNDPSKFEAFNKNQNRGLFVPNCLRIKEQYTEAAKQYEDFANNTHPSTNKVVYALYWAGWCYRKVPSNDEILLNKAMNVFERLIDNYGDNQYTSKTHEQLREIRSDIAIIDAEEAVYRAEQSGCESDAIDKVITHFSNAKQKQEQGNYAAACTLANKAQAIAHSVIDNHDTAKRYVNQGYTYLNQGQLETATKMARDAIRVDPPYRNAKKLLAQIKQKYFDQGTNYIKIEEYNEAIPPLEKAIAIDCQFKEAYYNLGRAYMKIGEFEKAKVACRAALTIDPTYRDALNLYDSIAD